MKRTTSGRTGRGKAGRGAAGKTAKSRAWFARAEAVIPGGVNSPVRAFQSVGGEPVYVTRGRGAYIYTADGARLCDYCGSWGPLVFGHSHPAIIGAIAAAAADGTSFGINTPREVEFAEQLCAMIPPMEMVRLVSSGTEAVMTALRLARGFTGRRKILKFAGCYHGHSDSLLVAAGSGLLTGGIASSAGVTEGTAADTCVAPYNDLAAVAGLVRRKGDELAAIVVEPVAGNMGLVPPATGFLEGLRELASRCGALLIFDEVISGFRLGPTTYGVRVGIEPDLTCLGKIIGGGLPIGAVGGRAEVMRKLAPLGPVYQAGTLSGNPVAVAAGMAMLRLLVTENPYPAMDAMAGELAAGLHALSERHRIPIQVHRMGGMVTPFFCRGEVHDLESAKRSNTRRYAAYFQGMLKRGVYLPPSQFEVSFVSAMHTPADIKAYLRAADQTLAEMR